MKATKNLKKSVSKKEKRKMFFNNGKQWYNFICLESEIRRILWRIMYLYIFFQRKIYIKILILNPYFK